MILRIPLWLTVRVRVWLRSSGNEFLYICFILFCLSYSSYCTLMQLLIWYMIDFSLHFVKEKNNWSRFLLSSQWHILTLLFYLMDKSIPYHSVRIKHTLTFKLLMPLLEIWKYQVYYMTCQGTYGKLSVYIIYKHT